MTGNLKIGVPCSENHVNTINKRLDFIGKNRLEFGFLLDIGCGNGILIAVLSKNARFCVGIDIVKGNIIESKDKNKGNQDTDFLLGASEELPFPNDFFDTVLMIEVMEHVENDMDSIKEVYRVLKPEGEFIVSVPNKAFPFETHALVLNGRKISGPMGIGIPLFTYFPKVLRRRFATARVYSDSDLTKMLTSIGFSIVEIDFLMPNFDGCDGRLIISHVIRTIKKLSERLESTWIKKFGSTVIVRARKIS